MKRATLVVASLVLSLTAYAQSATDLDCNGCVDTKELGNEAVGAAKLKPGSVTTGKIRNGAVTRPKVARSLKADLNTECPAGQVVVGKTNSGRFICRNVANDPTPSIRLLDANGLEFPFFANEIRIDSLQGWLQIPEGLTFVTIEERAIESDNRWVYSDAPDCSGQLFVNSVQPTWVIPTITFVLNDEVYVVNSSAPQTRSGLFRFQSRGRRADCERFDAEIDVMPARVTSRLPYIAPFRIEYR